MGGDGAARRRNNIWKTEKNLKNKKIKNCWRSKKQNGNFKNKK